MVNRPKKTAGKSTPPINVGPIVAPKIENDTSAGMIRNMP
jgi:hypothetical protein